MNVIHLASFDALALKTFFTPGHSYSQDAVAPAWLSKTALLDYSVTTLSKPENFRLETGLSK